MLSAVEDLAFQKELLDRWVVSQFLELCVLFK